MPPDNDVIEDGRFMSCLSGENRNDVNDCREEWTIDDFRSYPNSQFHIKPHSRNRLHSEESTFDITRSGSTDGNPNHTAGYEESSPITAISQLKANVVNQTVFKCQFCEKIFKRPWNLKLHQRTHTGYRPFVCRICQKKFIQASDLRKHVNIHLDSPPFTCRLCQKTFTYSSSLKTHERTHSSLR